MATSLTGPFLTDIASEAAPEPRPPQPIKATLIVLLCAAYMRGAAAATKADAAAIRPASFKNSRREALMLVIWLMTGFLLTEWFQLSIHVCIREQLLSFGLNVVQAGLFTIITIACHFTSIFFTSSPAEEAVGIIPFFRLVQVEALQPPARFIVFNRL